MWNALYQTRARLYGLLMDLGEIWNRERFGRNLRALKIIVTDNSQK
jgi:hypothetical protein